MYEKEDENAMMSWSTNFISAIITAKIFGDTVAFLGGTVLTDKTTID